MRASDASAAFRPDVRARASGENFPVALRCLPRARRADLLAIYDTARWIDCIGDEAPGDRLAQLDALERDLLAAFEGRAQHPILQALEPTLERRAFSPEPFLRLIEANRRDQRRPDLASWEELLEYCALSAAPIGELVLRVFDQLDPASLSLSNQVCASLQVVEHCQDVSEDFARGRIYLPAEDRRRFGCRDADLCRAPAPAALRRVVALQVERSRALLGAGVALVGRLRGFARLAVAAYVAGGLATCRALERAGFDPNQDPVRPRRRDRIAGACGLLSRGALA